MRKFLLGILTVAFVFCTALALPFTASANEEQGTEVFTQTKVQVSKNGDRMLIVTGIKDLSRIYDLGYDINDGYEVKETDVARNDIYYVSLTLSGVTITAGEFFAGAEGLLIWEIEYDSSVTYSITPYARLGNYNDEGQLIAPIDMPKTLGQVKSNFNAIAVNFVEEDGTPINSTSVNYGEKLSAPKAPYKAGYEFEGWYFNSDAYDFDTVITKPITLTAKYIENGKTVYSIANGNIKDITVSRNGVVLGQVGHDFQDGNGGVYALDYYYNGAEITGDTTLGVVFYWGDIKVSDYSSIKILYHATENIANNNTSLIYLNGTYTTWKGGGAQLVDIKALAVEKNIEVIQNLGVSLKGANPTGTGRLIVSYIELVKAESVDVNFVNEDGSAISTVSVAKGSTVTAPVAQNKDFYEFDGWYLGETKFDFATPITESITLKAKYNYTGKLVYSIANGNIMDVVTPLNGGVLTDNGTKLIYTYEGENILQNHLAGVTINLGAINVSDYASIKISAYAKRVNGANVNMGFVYLDNVEVASYYGGPQNFDLVSICNAKNITSFNSLEISATYYNGNPDYVLEIT